MTTRVERHTPSGELHRAQRAVGLLRIYLVFLLALYLLGLIAFGVSLFTEGLGLTFTNVGTPAILWVFITLGLLVYGLRELERRPLLVSSAVVTLHMIGLALGFYEGDVNPSPLILMPFLIYVVVNAARVERLAKEVPESYYARKLISASRTWSTAIGVGLALLFVAVTSALGA